MQRWIIISVLTGACYLAQGQDRLAYIESYRSIAISEMLRTGIPASIKLAQAMHESNCGKSELACKANNHFGIKCGNDWKGKTYNKEDDDYHDGKLVKSCFREFRNPFDSYIAHSDFLTDPAKSKRYGHLFELETSDYKGWAKGLSKAGYATDPNYANKIIDLIERYELYHLDRDPGKDLVVVHPEKSAGHRLLRYQNDVKYALAENGDTPLSFAQRNGISAKLIIRYNDDISSDIQPLEEGSIVYMQAKRSQYRGKQKVHLIKAGEDMTSISQKYGIRLDALYKRNGLQPGEIPAPNQKILLKGKTSHKLRTINPYDAPAESPIKQAPVQPVEETHSSLVASGTPVGDLVYESGSTQVIPPVMGTKNHTVAAGDTLYSIARQYGMPVDELKKINNLSADTIFIDQKLAVK